MRRRGRGFGRQIDEGSNSDIPVTGIPIGNANQTNVNAELSQQGANYLNVNTTERSSSISK